MALLGWSDAIRGIDRDTKELERRFLDDSGVDKRDFLVVIKTTNPDKQLDALTNVMTSGKLNSEEQVAVLSTFKKWQKKRLALERLTSRKYSLTVALTLTLFGAGIASLFTTSSQIVNLHLFSMRVELLILVFPLSLILILMGMIVHSDRRERALRELLNSIADMV